MINEDENPCIFTGDCDAPFRITRKYAGIMGRGDLSQTAWGVAGAQPATPGARHPHNFSKIEVFSRDVLDFWKGSKIEVTQCYLIELKALSDIIV